MNISRSIFLYFIACLPVQAEESTGDDSYSITRMPIWVIQDYWARNSRSAPNSSHQVEFQGKSEISWKGWYWMSPDSRLVFHTQKTGSGDNYGTLFERHPEGRISHIGGRTPNSPLSDIAWEFFRAQTGLDAQLYHRGVTFIGWGDDHRCVEFSLHGTDVDEKYWIDDWILHYNTATRKFFVAKGQQTHNKKAIFFRGHPATKPVPDKDQPSTPMSKDGSQ